MRPFGTFRNSFGANRIGGTPCGPNRRSSSGLRLAQVAAKSGPINRRVRVKDSPLNRNKLRASGETLRNPRLKVRQINPDTGKPFHDARSKLIAGRVICKGLDMKDLRERTGVREGEICQRCQAWAQLYPPEGYAAGEMHHIRGRGMGSSKRNDIESEQEWLCGGPSGCHERHHHPKACPPKVGLELTGSSLEVKERA